MAESEDLVQSETEQKQLVEQLLETVRKLRASGLYASEVEDLVVRELLADD